MGRDDPAIAGRFEAEIGRVRSSGALGESGRLLELFDFLASRGPEMPSASQAEIAEKVFGQTETSVDDATVRVYVHRLRKRLDDYYAEAGRGPGGERLALPSGTYALRLAGTPGGKAAEVERPAPRRIGTAGLILIAALALFGAFLLGRELPRAGTAPPANEMWQPFLASARPKLVVVGDYYMFGEIDHITPERSRLIRDFRVNSPVDLELMQDLEPERYGTAEDVGLNYLPYSVAFGLRDIIPVLARDGHQIRVIAASQLTPEMLNQYDVIYIGLVSGMGLLEDVTFMNSGFTVGESYDELNDRASGKTYTSEEASNLPFDAYYRDYGFITRFHAPSGALVAIVAGARDTGLRGIAPIAAEASLPSALDKVARGGDFEALYEITGQQGADLSEKLLTARGRR